MSIPLRPPRKRRWLLWLSCILLGLAAVAWYLYSGRPRLEYLGEFPKDGGPVCVFRLHNGTAWPFSFSTQNGKLHFRLKCLSAAGQIRTFNISDSSDESWEGRNPTRYVELAPHSSQQLEISNASIGIGASLLGSAGGITSTKIGIELYPGTPSEVGWYGWPRTLRERVISAFRRYKVEHESDLLTVWSPELPNPK